MTFQLLASAFVVATCGLVYELVAGALASYLLGDSVTQFSTVIGVYLFAMGVGSFASRYITRNHIRTFIQVEILVGILGGFSSTILFFAFAHGAFFQLVLYLLVFAIGGGVGLEIPLLMNILRGEMAFSDLVSRVLGFDYIGSLAASVAFPLLLLPHLGLVRTALIFGILNVGVALAMALAYSRRVAGILHLAWFGGLSLVALTIVFAFGDTIVDMAEASIYPDRVIYAHTTPYQRVVLTRSGNSLKLHLNGHLQFDSMDEYRYHEALVHVGLHDAPSRRSILVLGGGDGLAVREILKYPEVEQVTLIDLDPAMTALFKSSPLLAELNAHSLSDPRVRVINEDAFVWLRETSERFDFAVIDFPDPTNFALGKLYTTTFYKTLRRALTSNARVVIQSTSPLLARTSFWSIAATVESAGFVTSPYHAYVPSFGEWGYVLGWPSEADLEQHHAPSALPPDLRFISLEAMPSLFFFPDDMRRLQAPINRLNDQALVHIYEKEWGRVGL